MVFLRFWVPFLLGFLSFSPQAAPKLNFGRSNSSVWASSLETSASFVVWSAAPPLGCCGMFPWFLPLHRLLAPLLLRCLDRGCLGLVNLLRGAMSQYLPILAESRGLFCFCEGVYPWLSCVAYCHAQDRHEALVFCCQLAVLVADLIEDASPFVE